MNLLRFHINKSQNNLQIENFQGQWGNSFTPSFELELDCSFETYEEDYFTHRIYNEETFVLLISDLNLTYNVNKINNNVSKDELKRVMFDFAIKMNTKINNLIAIGIRTCGPDITNYKMIYKSKSS